MNREDKKLLLKELEKEQHFCHRRCNEETDEYRRGWFAGRRDACDDLSLVIMAGYYTIRGNAEYQEQGNNHD